MSTIDALGLILLILMIIVGGKQGIKSFASLLINFILLWVALLLFKLKLPIIIVTLVIGATVLATTIYLGSDNYMIAQTAFISSLMIMIIMACIIVPIEHFAKVQGFGLEDNEAIVGYSLRIGIPFIKMTISSALFSTLGAIAEASMAISTACYTLMHETNKITPKQLYYDGIMAGKDIIGTTLNTLFFGFFGGFLALFIWFVGLGYSWGKVINDKIFVSEILLILFAIIGVVLAVPMTAWFMSKQLKVQQLDKNGKTSEKSINDKLND